MADEFGIPQPDCAEDWQHFMLGKFDVMEEASNPKATSEAVRLLEEAREVVEEEFGRRFPGFGKGLAVW